MISKYFKPAFNPYKDCIPSIEQITVLANGKLYVTSARTDIACWMRCLDPRTDYTITIEKWIKVENGTRPTCDVFEVECLEYKNRTSDEVWTFYKYMHAQTYRKDTPKQPSTSEQQPDVHIILFDSVSHSQFIRSMPKTSHFLKEFYESISFRGYKTDYPNESWCEEYLDEDQFIGYRFQDAGYISMMSEDWAYGVFNWPNCWGFNHKPVDHYMRPFQIRVEGYYDQSPDMASKVYNGTCHEEFHHQMEYLKDFLRVYPDKPKFSITWMSYLAHNDANGLFHSDDYFYNFFKDYKEKVRL
uniref:Uncharacterized protein n=1 Tax=Panagrolaimus sp. ES5 TaxID=591445 RepID=A0AC34FD96_9BILA